MLAENFAYVLNKWSLSKSSCDSETIALNKKILAVCSQGGYMQIVTSPCGYTIFHRSCVVDE